MGNSIYLLTGYEGIASLLSLRHWLWTEAKPRLIKLYNCISCLLLSDITYMTIKFIIIIILLDDFHYANRTDKKNGFVHNSLSIRSVTLNFLFQTNYRAKGRKVEILTRKSGSHTKLLFDQGHMSFSYEYTAILYIW
jgi:hypothetical protein